MLRIVRIPRVASVLVLVALIASACAGSTPDTGARPNTSHPSEVFVSLGGIEATEFSNFSSPGDLWIQRFYRSELGTAATFYDFAVPTAELATVISKQLQPALALKPKVVVVFASLEDIASGTEPATYGQEIGTIVTELRAHRATVLVANVPPVELYPSYIQCFNKPASCGLMPNNLPTPAEIGAIVAAYDSAMSVVVRRDGGILVNVNRALTGAVHRGGTDDPFANDEIFVRSRGHRVAVRGPGSGTSVAYESALTTSGEELLASLFGAALPTSLKK